MKVFSQLTTGIAVLFWLTIGQALAEEYSQEQIEFFEKRIRPVLAEKCYRCHSASAEKLKAHLQVDHRTHLLSGGDRGSAIVPGDPEKSLLIESIRYETPDLQMPPKEALSSDVVEDFTKWIADGAAWPEEAVPNRESKTQEEKFDLEKRFHEHWSWRPVAPPAVPPATTDSQLAKNPIDHFLFEKLRQAGLRPALPAEKRKWIRRVSFDLVGLPPKPEQVQQFLQDESPEAYQKVVDGLLASPRFGEKWARHWMDLVRYAETYGHEFDYPIHHAHEYRDYLIRAFNADLPYDQFITEHIAGDLLEEQRRHPSEHYEESRLATAFWYLHEATHAPTDVRQDEADHMDNQIDVFGKSFLGLTISCARCHDHKFDAISTADYYGLTAYLHSSCRTEHSMDPGREREKAADKLKLLQQKGNQLLAEIDKDNVITRAGLAAHFEAATRLLRQEQNRKIPDTAPWEGTVFEDFESENFSNWKKEGTAFGDKPNSQNDFPKQKVAGDTGKFLANSFGGNQKLVGTLTSQAFPIAKAYLNFRIGGGKHVSTAVELLIANEVVKKAHGENSNSLRAVTWDLSPYYGKEAVIRIKDNEKKGWGYIFADQFVFSDVPAVSTKSLRYPLPEAVEAIAKSGSLNAGKLQAWLRVLTAEGNDLRQPAAFLTRAFTTAGGKVQQSARTLYSTSSEQIAKFEAAATPIAGYREQENGWGKTGLAFSSEKGAKPGIGFGKGRPFLNPDLISSSKLGDGQSGTLRSPTFEIETERIWVKARSQNLQARVVIDNYHMAIFSGLLFGGTIVKDQSSDGDAQWFSFSGSLKKYIGHRAFIEFVDKGNASVEIEGIWASNEAAPPLLPHPLVTTLASEDGDSELAQLGLGPVLDQFLGSQLESALADSLQKVKEGKDAAQHAESLNWLIGNGLLTLSDIDPGLNQVFVSAEKTLGNLPPDRFAISMSRGSAEGSYVHIRGSYRGEGEKVPARMLTALGGKVGDRLELARQVTRTDNPLTARVMVNRLWHHLFGRGIVASVDDFGPMGYNPSHPDLLDWLAHDFVEKGWSVKTMLKQIVLSHGYRQSSSPHPDIDQTLLTEVDPENILLHRAPIRRLPAESIRDSLLAVSGRLDEKMFGPPIPTHRTAFMTGRGGKSSGPLDGAGRRSIYGAVYRNFLSPFLLTFDQPSPFGPKGRRSVSNVPAQALALMNDPFVNELCKQWAENEASHGHKTPSAQIAAMYEKALGIPATELQIKQLQSFVETQASVHGALDDRAWADLAHVLVNAKKFIFLD